MRLFWKFFVFCIFGGIGALIELGIFNFLYFLKMGFPLSKFIALSFSVTFVFLTNRNITFGARDGKIRRQMKRYLIVYSIAFFFNYSVSLLVAGFLGPGVLKGNIAAASGIIAAIPITFLGSLLWIFKKYK